MKNIFSEFYPLENPEELWEKSLFVFDTNILLNFYRYSEETTKEFINTIKKLDRLWIPYQVGLEFHKKRLSVISSQKKSYEDFDKEISEVLLKLDNNKNPFLSNETLSKLKSLKMDIDKEVTAKKSQYESYFTNDTLLLQISELFNAKVGDLVTDADLKKIYAEGEIRYKNNVPPGYKDNQKPNNEKYGDLVIWKEIIKKAKIDAVNVIFISDDKKEDWWLEHQGKTISPRPELLKEFFTETGKRCYFYQPLQFLNFLNEYLNVDINKKTIEEIKNYQAKNENNENYVQLTYNIEGSKSEIERLFFDLKNVGYDVILEFVNDGICNLIITIPDIPDLERRIYDKYFNKNDNLKIKKII